MNAIKNKIRSREGASITFALLLFLVCAMASAVVIVAATTASGRMSNLPDIDQRYYAVSSAAELLRTTLDNQAVTVVTNKEKKTTKSFDASGNSTGDSKTFVNSPLKVYSGDKVDPSNGPVADTNYILMKVAVNLTGESQDLKDVQYTLTAGAGEGFKWNSEAITEANALSLLSVDITQKLEPDGTLTFDVSKSAGTGAAYTLRMVFAAEQTKNTVSHVDHGEPVLTDDDGSYTITDTETQTVTVTYKWTLTRVEKKGVPTT